VRGVDDVGDREPAGTTMAAGVVSYERRNLAVGHLCLDL
jgi:hypothetical protein